MIRFFLLCVAVMSVAFPGAGARAELNLSVTQGVLKPLPIAIPVFTAANGTLNQYATGIPDVISANLERSGLFQPLNRASFIQTPQSLATDGPRYPEWRAINAQALVSGQVTQTPDGKTRVEFRLFDVFTGQQISAVAYMTTPQNWRRIAHIISDDIYKRLTGEDAYFDSRIVYIAEAGPPQRRVKRLAIIDQDGFNNRFLTDGANLVLTPRFSPNAPVITYLAYVNNKPRVYLYNIDTGRQEVLGDFPGMTFAPRFSPDGNGVVLSYAKDGNTDIYLMDLRSRRPKQLTNHPGIDTAPTFSPDGRRIAFESDRGGSQQLYVMDAGGNNVQRITFGQGRYGNPVWSPRGDLIAFTKMHKGTFYIGVIRPDGSGERLITSAFHVEGPTWSPNGRVLMYFKENNQGGGRSSKLYSIDITGYNERLVATPQDGSDPAWSPLNK